MLEYIVECYPDEELLVPCGLDDAVIGIDENSMRLIYSVSKCIEILMKDMDREKAVDFFEFNVCGGYVGERTPIWCDDDF